MGDYFKPLPRKVGLLTLLMACVLAGMWARGFATQDLLLLGKGQRIVTRGSEFVILSSSARDGFVWARREFPGMSWLAGWQVRRTDAEDYFDPFGPGEDVMTPDFRDYHWQFVGIDVGRYHHEIYDEYGNSDIFSFWRISYWSIVPPLTLVSLWLLLNKPPELTPKKTEPIADPDIGGPRLPQLSHGGYVARLGPPIVNHVTEIVIVFAVGSVSVPPIAVPPLSCTWNLKVA